MARRRLAGLGVASLLVLTGCGSGSSPSAPKAGAVLDPLPSNPAPAPVPSTTTPDAPPATGKYTTATATGKSVAVYDSPVQPEPSRSLGNPQSDGSTLVLLAKDQQGPWLKVLLPVRPNGATGWIRTSDVTVATHDFRIEVEIGTHTLTVWRGDDMFLQDTVAVGAAATPTTLGSFYTTGLFDTASTQPVYGPYAYPLSGYSDVLYSFNGGEGQMGIHGTSDPSSLGRSVSNGCIRMSNRAITKLAETLPVGVPVEIRA